MISSYGEPKKNSNDKFIRKMDLLTTKMKI